MDLYQTTSYTGVVVQYKRPPEPQLLLMEFDRVRNIASGRLGTALLNVVVLGRTVTAAVIWPTPLLERPTPSATNPRLHERDPRSFLLAP
jgi:hypothetical protein